MNAMQQAIDTATSLAAESILDLLRLGWSFETAARYARNASTLGPQSWNRVLQIVVERRLNDTGDSK